ncbi:MAG: acyl-CoA carboxylase subunit beta [Candidatus Omnitrophica bacterium]|nr:acyl-CoA carboxylase subunit beta [Candidatus Omnitrophota bacterium]
MNTPNPNRAANEKAVAELRGHLAHHERPFSNSAIEKQHQKNKLTVAERLDLLFDPGEERFEIGTFAAMGMYEEHGEIVSAGVRTVLGRVSGHDCMVIASDSMVKGGAWFPLTAKKTLLAQEIALENRLPVIYLVDSAGIFLPLAAESFADRDHAGRIFYHNARLSALGVPQIAAVMGPCVAGGAYIPALCDELLMVRGTSGIFLAGPHLVKAAIGEEIDIEKLGGADTHMQLSGMADYEDDSDAECLERIRRLAAHWPTLPPCSFPIDEPAPPELDPERLLEILPGDRRAAYDMREILKCIVDSGSWEEYKADYGATLLAGTARIEGRVVGILANQRLITRTGRGEMQIGGVLYSDSADKGARFVLVCNQKRIPILFFQDVTGFMVGGRAEQGGIIKDGAKLVNAVSNTTVPKLTIVVGNSNGAGNYALCGRAYGPRFMVAWPSARIAVMGGDQAASTLLSIEKTKAKAALTKEQEAELLERLRKVYDESASPYHAASRLWIDAVIDPRNSRAALAHLLRIACRRDPAEGFRVGVFQV